jgi:hypothetical protein
METISTNEIRLANLKSVAEMRRAELRRIHTGVTRQIAKVVEDAVAASGVGGYALRKGEDGELHDTEYMTLKGEIDGERLHDIDMHFSNDPWREGEDNNPRVLSVNTCCFGNIKAGDKSGVAYCVIMGYLATHLQEIQDALNSIPEWEAYDRARRVYSISRNEAEAFERKLAEEAKTARRAEIEKRLVVGAEIAYAHDVQWSKDEGRIFTGVRTKVIEKVTAKLLFFKGDNRQYKKEEALGLLSKGVNRCGWSFAADVDITQFPCKVIR